MSRCGANPGSGARPFRSLLLVAALFCSLPAPGTPPPPPVEFVGVGVGAIPDGVEDLTATLRVPGGVEHSLFGRVGLNTGQRTYGDSSDFGGLYLFGDSLSGFDLWDTAAGLDSDEVIPTGDHRTSNPGFPSLAGNQPPTSIAQSLLAVDQPNGSWTVTVTENCEEDVGIVTSAKLFLSGIEPGEELCTTIVTGQGGGVVFCL